MDTSVVETHYRANHNRLVKILTFRAGTPEDAEDVVQEAYARSLKYFKSFNGENFNRWFTSILNNCLRELKNVQKGHAADLFEEEEADGTQCPHYANEILKEIRAMIEKKNPDHRMILSMHFDHEYSAIDISRLTEFSYAKCHQVIQRFRNELKSIYK